MFSPLTDEVLQLVVTTESRTVVLKCQVRVRVEAGQGRVRFTQMREGCNGRIRQVVTVDWELIVDVL